MGMIIDYKGRKISISDEKVEKYDKFFGGDIADVIIWDYLYQILKIEKDEELAQYTDEELSDAVEKGIDKEVSDLIAITELWAKKTGE